MKARLLVLVVSGFALSATIPGSASPGGRDPLPATAGDVGRALGALGDSDRAAAEQLASAQKESSELDVLLSAKGRAYVKLMRAGLLPVGGGLEALIDHAARLERLRRALSRGLERQRALADLRVKLSSERQVVTATRSALVTEQAALARSHSAILAAEERELAFRQAFLGNPDGHTAVYSSGFGPAVAEGAQNGFVGMKGRLPIPIEGRVEVRTGKVPGADGPCLELVAESGAPVRAVFGGRVAFADTYGSYGTTVIVDHGGGYFSVSANLGALLVHVGEEIRSGTDIGSAPEGSRRATVYFELRRGSDSLDPGTWFGL